MTRTSAGLLVYRSSASGLEVLIVHPGGPYWSNKDDGAWSVPKGEYGEGDDPLLAARREFEEELGQAPPVAKWIDLGVVRQAGGKTVRCFAVEGDVDVDAVVSNTFSIEWPPRSGQMQVFPEVDRAAWVSPEVARVKLLQGQVPFVERLLAAIG